MTHVETASLTPSAAVHYAFLRLHLKSQGSPTPAKDLWIAALVRGHRIPLLSRNAHFDHCPDLQRLSF